MIIFENNSFTKDTLVLRTSRLLALKTYINDYEAELSIPSATVTWSLASHDNWTAALTKSHLETAEASEAYQTMHEADEACFDYYIKCKALILDRYEGEDNKLKVYGVEGAFPQSRKRRLKAVKDLLDGNERLTTEGDPNVLPPAFITNLQTLYDESYNTFTNLMLKEKEEALDAVDEQNTLFDADTKQLRALYSWVLMTWTYYEPKLILLGFAPRTERHGGGQPDAPTGLLYDEPTETFSWNAVTGATSYQLSYIEMVNGEETGQWQEAYSGAAPSVVFTPAAGEWKFKVRARDAQGYGGWSNVVVVNIGAATETIVIATKQNPPAPFSMEFMGNVGEEITIDYGDGTIETITMDGTFVPITHTYADIGNYVIRATGSEAAFVEMQALNGQHSSINLPEGINLRGLTLNDNQFGSLFIPTTYTDMLALSAANNDIDQQSINLILVTINDFGTSNGVIYLNGGNNQPPSGQGLAAMNQLLSRGWTVVTN